MKTQELEKAVSDTVSAARDTVAASGAHGGGHDGGFDFSELLHHMRDGRTLELPGFHVELPQLPPLVIGHTVIDISVTKHVVFLVLSAVLLLVLGVMAARSTAKSTVPSGVRNLLEVVIVFVRDEIAVANMGTAGLKYLPYLLSTFFLILFMNLFGLIPYGATPTANISVTAALAAIAFIMIQVAAIRAQGLGHYLAHLTGGTPLWLWPIMVPIEIIGLFTKPFALCMRLFANMTGGHIVVLALLGFIFLAKSFLIAPASVLFVVGIYLLELLVAFIQAYIFTMLTAVFMGLGMTSAEHAEEGH
jgi:F-type H+-transporting ATPase subunit a